MLALQYVLYTSPLHNRARAGTATITMAQCAPSNATARDARLTRAAPKATQQASWPTTPARARATLNRIHTKAAQAGTYHPWGWWVFPHTLFAQDGNANPDASASNKPKRVNDEPFTGNAVQYWLKKADESLDEIEERPTETAKVSCTAPPSVEHALHHTYNSPQALYEVSKEVSKSPVGTATAKGVELVAKLSLMAGKEAVKVAVPAAGQVAKWAVAQGARAAMGAVQNSVKSGLAGDKKAKLGDGQQAKENGKDAPK